jgi:acyl-CoA synthetase (AMP-forming)/AMP-acid ligase II
MDDILQRIRAHARRSAQAVAIARRESDGSYTETTFGQVATDSEAFAQAFASHAPGNGIVPILAAKTAATVAALFGASASGHVAACLNPKLRVPQVERILHAGMAQVGVLDGTGLLALKGPYSPASPIRRTRWWLVRGPGFLPMHASAAGAMRNDMELVDWPVARQKATLPELEPDAAALCLFTSGSTGVPKGVLVGRRDLVERAETEIEWFGLTQRDVLLSVLPFSFDVGLNQLVASLAAGATLVILDSWMPADILRAVADRGVTGISAVPSIWRDFLEAGLRFDRAGAHRSLRFITVSGGDLQPPQLEALPALGEELQIFKTYGQTEVFRPTCLLPAEFDSHQRSVGRPFGRSRVYVVRDDGSLAAPGERGEIVATGLGVMLGYLDGRDEQRKLRDNPFRGPDDPCAKAIFTGDVGHVDEHGYLYLHGRRDAMLKIKGNRIYPEEVAAQLLALPGVVQAEVVGVDERDRGCRLFAFVVLDPDAPAPDVLRRQLSSRVPAYMVPEAILTLDSIPRTASGKPDYPALVAEAKSGVDASTRQGSRNPPS